MDIHIEIKRPADLRRRNLQTDEAWARIGHAFPDDESARAFAQILFRPGTMFRLRRGASVVVTCYVPEEAPA